MINFHTATSVDQFRYLLQSTVFSFASLQWNAIIVSMFVQTNRDEFLTKKRERESFSTKKEKFKRDFLMENQKRTIGESF